MSLDASSVPAQPGGAGRYVIELAQALAGRADVGLLVVSRRGDEDRWRHLEGVDVMARAPANRPSRLAWEQAALPRALRLSGVDVHHGPHYTMPELARVPRVVTIHDLFFVEHPRWHQPAKIAFFRRAIRVAARRAEAIVAVSASTASRLEALFSPRAPVHVIPHGVDHTRFRPLDADDGEGAESDAAARLRIGATQPYIAFVGTLEPRKDVPGLVRAFDRLASARPELSLVVAGAPGWGTQAVEEAIRSSAHGDRVRLAGYVSETEKAALLRGAAAVAYPSLDEGFGLPALEALACGSPLVTTSGTAMEEVAPDGALLITPGDAGRLAEALEALLDGGPEIAARRQRGLERACRYTWGASAEAHVAVYRSLA